MARKKRAWNSSNPLYRYLQAKRGGKIKARRKKSTGQVNNMARRRKSYSRRSKGGLFGGSDLMTYGIGVGIGAFGKGISSNLPLVNTLPTVAQTPAVAAGAALILKKDPVKMAIGALIGSMLFGGNASASVEGKIY
jgi:hypothetical protein